VESFEDPTVEDPKGDSDYIPALLGAMVVVLVTMVVAAGTSAGTSAGFSAGTSAINSAINSAGNSDGTSRVWSTFKLLWGKVKLLWGAFGAPCTVFFSALYVFYSQKVRGSMCHVVENKSQSMLDIAVKMTPFDDYQETELNENPLIGIISLFKFKRVCKRNKTNTGKDAQELSLPSAGKPKILGEKYLCYYTLRSFTINYDPDKDDGQQHGHWNHSGYIVHRLNRTLAKQ
jgi:hypothetical protein